MDEMRSQKVKEVTNRLLQNLDDLVTSYRHLLEVVRQEKDSIANSNLEQMNQHNENKEVLLMRIKSLDSIRERYAKELANLVQLDSEYPRLLELAQRVPFELAEKMRLSHATLDLLIRRLQKLNQHNQVVVESALNTLHGALNDLRDALAPTKTYGRDKKMGALNEGAGMLRNQKA